MTIYERVDLLEQNYNNLESDVMQIEEKMTDSGWIDLPLTDGITAYSEEQKPRYRKIGKDVFISGVLKGVTEKDTTVATLPEGFGPSKKVILPIASIGQMFTKMTVNTNGTIIFNRSSIEPVIEANWHSVACNFSTN